MRQHSFLTRPASVAAAVLLASASVGRAAPPTPDELDRLAAGTDYRAAATALKVVLKLDRKAKVAAPYDFVHVWTELATVDLNQGDFAGASAAAKKGAAEAEADGQVEAGDQVLAMSRLIDRSKAGVYTTRNGGNRGKRFTVADPDQRTAAYADLFADEVAAVQSGQEQAKAKRTIDSVLTAADNFKALRAMDRIVNHSTAVTDPLSLAAAKDADALIETWMRDQNGDLDVVAADAATVVRPGKAAWNGGHVQHQAVKQVLNGLTNVNRRKVRMVADTTAGMDAAVERMDNGFARPGVLAGIHATAAALNRRANALLNKYPA